MFDTVALALMGENNMVNIYSKASAMWGLA